MLQLIGRLILLLIIVSVIRSVLRIGLRLWAGFAGAKARPSASRSASAKAAPDSHMSLMQDPVCGTYVATDTSLKRIVDGKVIHFCSAECRDQYSA